MDPIETAAQALQGNLQMLSGALADFSEPDFFVRPCPSANHAAWQIGQLIVAETMMIGFFTPEAKSTLPDGFDKKFTKETSKIDDPSFFGSGKELLVRFNKTRGDTVDWVKTLKLPDLERPSPERIRSMAPTLGHLIYLTTSHVAMHMGQIQVIRRKLSKPVLF